MHEFGGRVPESRPRRRNRAGGGTATRPRVIRLLARFPERPVWAAFVLCMGFLSTANPLRGCDDFPHPFHFPRSRGDRNSLLLSPHVCQCVSATRVIRSCHWDCVRLQLTGPVMGLQHAGSAIDGPIGAHRVLAVALSPGCTAFFMVLLKVAHAPAGATTLIVSLGIITRPWHLAIIEIAVALLCLQAICFNRLAGLNYPLWIGPVDSAMEELRTGRRLEERKESISPRQ